MTVTRPIIRLALLLPLALGGCKIVSDKELAAVGAKSPNAFDATAYVEKIWTPTAVTDFKTSAVDLATLLPEIEADPEKAGKPTVGAAARAIPGATKSRARERSPRSTSRRAMD